MMCQCQTAVRESVQCLFCHMLPVMSVKCQILIGLISNINTYFVCLCQQVQYRAVEDYNGACCPLSKGLQTFFRTPCTEEPRIPLNKGDTILATRGTKWVLQTHPKHDCASYWGFIFSINKSCNKAVFLFFRWWMYGDKVLNEQQVAGEMTCLFCGLN